MQYLRIIFIAFLTFVAVDSFGQSRKHKKKDDSAQEPTSLDPTTTTTEREYAPKASRKSSHGPTHELEEEYYKRMAHLEKSRRKNERLASKPQYSDPLYFGHKHPPKKRKPSKMKFCKQCGIRH
jgi:hypothetical protein